MQLTGERRGARRAALGFMLGALFTGVPQPVHAQAPVSQADLLRVFDLPLDELLEVSVFQIDPANDVCYQASQSITGSRMATERTHLPFPVTVLTEELLEDMAAYDVEDAIPYIGSVNKQRAERDGEVRQIRGFEGTPGLRNGLIVQGYSDSVNWQRIEVIKGSPSVLYGQTNPAGVLNYITKHPSFEADHRGSLTYGSYDLRRLEVETTGPIGSDRRLAYRYAGSFTGHESEEPHEDLEKTYHAPSVTLRLTETVTLQLDYEYLERNWTPSQGPALTRDPNGFLRYDTSLGGGREHAQWRGPDDYFDNDHAIFNAFLDWKMHDRVSYRFSFADSEYNRDVYARNPGFLFTAPADGQVAITAATLEPGEPASHIGRYIVPTRRTIEQTTSEQMRHDLQIDVDLRDTQHSVVFSYDRFRIRSGENPVDTAYDWRITPPWDPAHPRNNNPDGSVGWPKMPESAFAAASGSVEIDFADTTGFDAWSVMGLSSAMDNRLHVMWGARYDEIVNPPVEDTPYAIGAAYEIMGGVSPFANYGTSFQNNGRGRNNEVLDPEKGASTEVGIKFCSEDGRISGSVSYFWVGRSDVVRRVDVFDESGLKTDELTLLSGEEESRGVDVGLVIQMRDNWSTFISASFFDSDVLSNDAAPAEIGMTPRFAAEEMAGLFTRYDVSDGPLTGFSFGLGANYRGAIRLGDAVDKDWTHQADARLLLDAMVRYTFPAHALPAALTLNISNLTDEEYVDRWQGWGDPRRAALTFRCAL